MPAGGSLCGCPLDSAVVTGEDQAQLPPQYAPGNVEPRLYDRWESSGLFTADAKASAPPFTIVIPPPNVTGSLHIGHALDHTLIDALVRRRRMQGYNALWLPGMDHAGIATQNVVERELANEGLSRHDLGREKFVERVWQWKAESGGKILGQMRRLGDSVDWSRERFTMDEGSGSSTTVSSIAPSGSSTGARAASQRSPTSRSTTATRTANSSPSATGRPRIPSWSPRPGRKRCSATPRWPSIPTTRGTATWSAGRSNCRCRAAASRWWPTRTSTRSSAPGRSR